MYERLVPRALVTLLPLAVVLLHIFGILRLGLLDKVDQLIYDGRLLATMPRSLDDRIVIVDIDEKSLAEQGRWPWQRSKLAAVTEELFGQQQVAVVGFDIVFAEPDDSSGLSQLRNLASGPLKHLPEFSRPPWITMRGLRRRSGGARRFWVITSPVTEGDASQGTCHRPHSMLRC